MKVLVACEESQTVCKAFRERGHEAYSCASQTPSNADRIRNMNDEELAMLLYEIGYEGGWGALEGTLEWLQQPAEETDNG